MKDRRKEARKEGKKKRRKEGGEVKGGGRGSRISKKRIRDHFLILTLNTKK